MKTLEEYNKDFLDQFSIRKESQFSTGIACNNCGHELTRSSPGLILLTSPGQERVHCDNCGFKGTMYV